MITNLEFVEKALDVAKNYKTLYVNGCFGAPLTLTNKTRFIGKNKFNNGLARKAKILAASADTFGFDCVCLIKALLWGWSGDQKAQYGGAKYASLGVPDIDTEGMIAVCRNISTDFSKISIGEVLWLPGHIGIYIGDGKCVECTPSWKDGVQITDVLNITGNGTGHRWMKHGKLPYVEYVSEAVPKVERTVLETGNDIVWQLMNGALKVEITEPARAVRALDEARYDERFVSLYWIIRKIVNGK